MSSLGLTDWLVTVIIIMKFLFLMLLLSFFLINFVLFFFKSEIHRCSERKKDGFKNELESMMKAIENEMLKWVCEYPGVCRTIVHFLTCA